MRWPWQRTVEAQGETRGVYTDAIVQAIIASRGTDDQTLQQYETACVEAVAGIYANMRQFIDYLEFDFVNSSTIPVIVIGHIFKHRSTLPFVASGVWGTAGQVVEWSFTINPTGVSINCLLYTSPSPRD